jgi:hypothetical protein
MTEILLPQLIQGDFSQLPASLLDVSAATTEHWWMNQELLELIW